MKLVTPETFLIGMTQVDWDGLEAYLKHTDQLAFLDELKAYPRSSEGLCSFFAKLCYSSLVADGRNLNVSKVRPIADNLRATIESAHGSVFEHVYFNFVSTDVSRVFTHELVRHRAGTAFSQTSGRYVRSEELSVVLGDPIGDMMIEAGDPSIGESDERPLREILSEVIAVNESCYQAVSDAIPWSAMTFENKKKVTSYLRRVLPNGIANEIGWSCNLRSIRQMVQMRTSRHAEWEIRLVFSQVYNLLKHRFPLMWEGATEEVIDNVVEVSGLRLQPYEK